VRTLKTYAPPIAVALTALLHQAVQGVLVTTFSLLLIAVGVAMWIHEQRAEWRRHRCD